MHYSINQFQNRDKHRHIQATQARTLTRRLLQSRQPVFAFLCGLLGFDPPLTVTTSCTSAFMTTNNRTATQGGELNEIAEFKFNISDIVCVGKRREKGKSVGDGWNEGTVRLLYRAENEDERDERGLNEVLTRCKRERGRERGAWVVKSLLIGDEGETAPLTWPRIVTAGNHRTHQICFSSAMTSQRSKRKE